MERTLVNGLSVNNLSGRHVLLGHLRQLASWTRDTQGFDVLFHAGNQDMVCDLGNNVSWVECPSSTVGWARRALWEVTELGRLARKLGSLRLFSPSGIWIPGLAIPQYVLAQNPWALVAGLERTATENFKAAIQRRNYKVAVRHARMMFFNSNFMRQVYLENAGHQANHFSVVYQALDEEVHSQAEKSRAIPRNPNQLLSVSAMAPHKNAETLVDALGLLREQHGITADLVIAGSWPDRRYRDSIEQRIVSLNLQEQVRILGHVSREELLHLYASSQVFVLMSRCESFGIPAIEAQVFGTPVVSSDCCAIPEICGVGGVFHDPADAMGVAASIGKLLHDKAHWEALSCAARTNAQRFHWEECSRGLMAMFD